MLAAIGEVTSASAEVDDRLRDLFCDLIDSSYGRIITAGEDTSRIELLCQRVMRFNRHLTDEQVEELNKLFKALDKLREWRNFVVHARWFKLDRPGDHYGYRSSRPSPKPEGRQTAEERVWTHEEVLRVAEYYRALDVALLDFMERAWDDRPKHGYLLTRSQLASMDEWLRPAGDVPPSADEDVLPPG
jgi:hypothetical protein